MNTFQISIQQNTQRYTESATQLKKDWETLTSKFQDWKDLGKNTPITKQSSVEEINRAKQALLPEIEILETLYKSQNTAEKLIKEIEESMPKWICLATSISSRIQVLSSLSCATLADEADLGRVNQFVDEKTKTKKIMQEHVTYFTKELPVARKHVTTQFKAVTDSSWGILDSFFAWPSFEEMIAKCKVPSDAPIALEKEAPHDEKKESAITGPNIVPPTQPSISAPEQPTSTTSTAPATGICPLTLPLVLTACAPDVESNPCTPSPITGSPAPCTHKVTVTKKDSKGTSRPIHQITQPSTNLTARKATPSQLARVPSAASE